ncbi:MAG: tetratricopeptide repeat protein [Chitinophagaceae bacterium]|nr:tetratricopeptide repeat protein [Chitinophagaceae bacterium]
MIKYIVLVFGMVLLNQYSVGQGQENIIYVIDSIPVVDDPQDGDEIVETDIADIRVIINKDTLKMLGYDRFDRAIFIFTTEYRQRPEDQKQIPSSKQMERKNSVWHFRGYPYTGKFIDYYYSGRKQGDGTFLNGKVEGLRRMYHQNGQLSLERNYSAGIEHGLEKEYYEDGTLKQKGEFVNGIEEGIWQMYFPNGQVKQQSTLRAGNIEGETIVYYSTGKVLAVEITKNGKTSPDKRLAKVNEAMNKGHADSQRGDYKAAIKKYSKAIELDSSNAEAYFARGTAKLNDFQFNEAILDFDKALVFEPYFEKALSNRAFTRIRKYQFGSGRKLSESNAVTVLASKDNPGIPEHELAIICNDLQQAIFLGDKGKMILDAVKEYCGMKGSR